MADCKKCRNLDGTLFNALESIVWYNGHYEWLKELRDNLVAHRDSKPKFSNYCSPLSRDEWYTDKHAIWMLLVGMYGDWGTSIRGGWIENIDGCIEFINVLCEDSWKADEE